MTDKDAQQASERSANLVRFKHCVQGLAARAEDQLRIHPTWVQQADELALDFGHWRDVAMRLHFDDLSESQRSALADLNSLLEDMSGVDNAELWEPSALQDNPEWERVRELARVALAEFDWPEEAPPPSPDSFVPGR